MNGLTPDAAKQLKVLQIISFALIVGVTIFASVVTVLTYRGGISIETIPIPSGVMVGLAIVTIIGASKVGTFVRERPAAGRDDVLQNYSMSVIISQALRESVGLVGTVVGLFTGDPITTMGFASVSVAAMLIGFPRADDLELVMKRFESGRKP